MIVIIPRWSRFLCLLDTIIPVTETTDVIRTTTTEHPKNNHSVASTTEAVTTAKSSVFNASSNVDSSALSNGQLWFNMRLIIFWCLLGISRSLDDDAGFSTLKIAERLKMTLVLVTVEWYRSDYWNRRHYAVAADYCSYRRHCRFPKKVRHFILLLS